MGAFAFLINLVLYVVPGLSWILSRWQICNTLPSRGVDAIALISYAAHRDGLTRGSLATTREMSSCVEKSQIPTIVGWGVFRGSTANMEETGKVTFMLVDTTYFVGAVTSSTDECEAILSAWKQAGENPQSICVVTEGAHSRRDRVVWRHFLPRYFPDAKLYFRSIDARLCSDQRNPMAFQRYWRVWLLFNVAFYLPYTVWPGVPWFAKKNFRQPSR